MTLSMAAFGVLLGLTFLGIPIAWTMIGVGFAGVAALRGIDPALAMVGQVAFETAMSYDLSVVPMFVLMGNLVNHARLSHQLYDSAHSFVGHRRGGLAMATILSCGGFAAISGSSIATAATMAKVAIPSMRRFRYADGFAAATVAAGARAGSRCTIHSIATRYMPIARIPGRIPATNSSPMSARVRMPYTTITTDGGIRIPRVPPAATVAAAKPSA